MLLFVSVSNIPLLFVLQYGSSSAVNTVLTFVERKSPEEYSSAQDTQVALAKLYAHVQAMPESAKKKKLLKQFNRASGVHASGEGSERKKGKHVRSRTFGESLKVGIVKGLNLKIKCTVQHENG